VDATAWDTVEDIHQHLKAVSPLPPEQHLSVRVLKIQEEAGEAAQALLGTMGASHRKGISHSVDDLAKELCDVITTGMCALRELTPDAAKIFAEHLAGLRARGDAGKS
jgi:NTP pyrophosphatase (non-canonical NTP hydrolase)